MYRPVHHRSEGWQGEDDDHEGEQEQEEEQEEEEDDDDDHVGASTEPREEGAMRATGCGPGGGLLGILHKLYQTALGILARLNVP